MGTGLIPADGEIWKVRRRAIVPALHKWVLQKKKERKDCAGSESTTCMNSGN